jgi:serine/threonine protein kinase
VNQRRPPPPRQREPDRTLPDHAARRIDETRLDGYGVVSEIARGGTSTIYLGEDLATGERVAIKALAPFYLGHHEMAHRLLREYGLANRARHPGLIDIRCAGQTSHGIPYIVMEYLDGESLGALADRLPPPVASITRIAGQIASAVAALHAAGVVHCDIKPDNVFVLHEPGPGGWPRVKVLDYGVARLVDDPPPAEAAVAGTPAFMAPEQWRGAPTRKSDVYSLGCVLYELITGSPMFSGSLPQLMMAHCERIPEQPSTRCIGLDPELERLVVRALAKDPEMRPTMNEMDAELARLAPQLGGAMLDAHTRRLHAVG